MRFFERPGVRTGFLVLVLFTLIAGDAWRYTVGWVGFGVLTVLVTAASVALIVLQRRRWRLSSIPYPLAAFLVYAVLSVTWSFYPAATALGIAATLITTIVGAALAVTYSWREILRCLGLALRLVLGLSLLFELVVAVFVRGPVLPIVASPGVDYSTLETIPKMLYWSRNELFEVFDGGRIQGIVGNSALLAFAAIVGVIVFALQLADGSARRGGSIFWLAVAAATLLFTRSATVTVALVAVAAVAAAILLVRRAPTPRARALTYGGALVVLAAGIGAVVVFHEQILGLLGKSDDLTGRIGIWEGVIGLAQQRPAFGWGWVSYWIPWVAPFNDPAFFRNGVQQTHAHNAWLDVWLQLGVVGVVLLGALVLSALARSWSFAADRPQVVPAEQPRHTVVSLLPVLLLVALLVQSLAESRLLVEFGWVMMTAIAIKTKAGEPAPRDVSSP
ncbi:MAG: O-antigen ligase protein [Rhodoglobus sp.]|nr:O-antigen ligase protein [Rhodoglobus sp.]